jgi:uncharacterized damage-inducible protein DinB
MKEHYLRLYSYNEWANDLFANALAEADYSHEKINVFFSHIAAAQLIWLNRVTESDQEVPGVWEKLSLEEASEQLSAGNIGWLDFIAECDDFESEVRYKNTKGETFTTPLKDILTHVANHSTHHRGQIALLLREEGIAPPASDFIFYSRICD